MSRLLKYMILAVALSGAAHAFAQAVADTPTVDTLTTATASAPAEATGHLFTYLEKLIVAPYTGIMAALLFLLFFLFIWFRSLAKKLDQQLADPYISEGPRFDLEQARSTAIASRQTAKFFGWTFLLGYLLYVGVHGSEMEGYVTQWLNLALRWTHLIAGIMWIGASFYFIFLENNLNRTEGLRDELAGNLWAIHGGGFYYVEKYEVAPKVIPKHLHWFKYEAYFTWLSGFSLLFIVYYADAKAFMIDPSVAALSPAEAICIGIGSMVVGWAIYDLMSKSKLVLRQDLFALVGILVLGALTYVLTHLLSGRAAYIHVGALLGTIMAGNVFYTIIPSQKALVRAAKTGQPLDATLGKKAGQRSLHNNYITLPVVFIMLSNHFPSTFGHSGNWIILMVITVASMGIKHYWNLLDRGVKRTWVLVASIGALVVLSAAISPAMEDTVDDAIPVSFSDADAIIQRRCVQCHSADPTDDVNHIAPNGVKLDTPEEIKAMASRIMERTVRTHTMPQGNKTGMTEEERTVLKRWILQGAKID